MIKMELVPLKRIGPFVFNSSLSDYMDLPLEEQKDEFIESIQGVSYKLKDRDMRIYVEDGKIDGAACYDECILNDTDLIGLEEDVLKSIVGCKISGTDTMDLDEGEEKILEYDDIGIMVFIKNGFVKSVTCHGKDE